MRLRSAYLVAVCAVLAASCTNDYDEFEFRDGDAGTAGAGAGGGGGSGASCGQGEIDCGGSCVDPGDDPQNCGACGTVCGAGFDCADSLCRCSGADSCGAGDLNPECVADGRCRCDGDTCRLGERCIADGPNDSDCACNGGPGCGFGEVCCADGCQSVFSDEQNCGACGRACASGEQCEAGSCEP